MKKYISIIIVVFVLFSCLSLFSCAKQNDIPNFEFKARLISMRYVPSLVPESISKPLNGKAISLGDVNKLSVYRVDSYHTLTKLQEYYAAEYNDRTEPDGQDPFTFATKEYDWRFFFDNSLLLIPICTGFSEQIRGLQITYDGDEFCAIIDTYVPDVGSMVISYYFCVIEIPKQAARHFKLYDVFEYMTLQETAFNNYVGTPSVITSYSYKFNSWDIASISDKKAKLEQGEYNVPIFKCDTVYDYIQLQKHMGGSNYYSFVYDEDFFDKYSLVYGFFSAPSGYKFEVEGFNVNNNEFRAKVVQISSEGEANSKVDKMWQVIICVPKKDIENVTSFAIIRGALK